MKPGVSSYMEARARFRKLAAGVVPEELASIVQKGSNKHLGWWRSMRIRQAWREMCRDITRQEDELNLLARYCPGVELT